MNKLSEMSRYTQDQYKAICEAISLGATKVKYADKEVEYRSLQEMERIREQMEGDLGVSINKNKRRYASYGRGIL